MTILVLATTLLLSLVAGRAIVDTAEVATIRARAQAAADAAALAAVVESGPSGGGAPRDLARRFADANGADLLACLCDQAATVVQVRVVIDGVEAEARAVWHPDRTGVAPGLDSRLAAAVGRLVAAAGGRVFVVSGWRSTARQSDLWAAALRRYGTPEAADDWVAPPGHSMHERGLAVDLGGDVALAAGLVERLSLPLYRPLDNEPWHFELVGSRGLAPQ